MKLKRALSYTVLVFLGSALGCDTDLMEAEALDATAVAEADALSSRVVAIQAELGPTGTLTPELRQELDELERAFEDWGERHGRDDLKVTRSTRDSACSAATDVTPLNSDAAAKPLTSAEAATIKWPRGKCSHNCLSAYTHLWYICFLDEVQCDQGGNTCAYRCYRFLPIGGHGIAPP